MADLAHQAAMAEAGSHVPPRPRPRAIGIGTAIALATSPGALERPDSHSPEVTSAATASRPSSPVSSRGNSARTKRVRQAGLAGAHLAEEALPQEV